MPKPALAVHGGAWNVPDGEIEPHLLGVAAALRAGWALLEKGGAAVDVVEATVRILEDDPIFNAGRGAHLNSEGRVELDASIMAGDRLEAGAVAAVERVRNPVSLARAVMDRSEHVLLVGEGALRYAREHGVETCRSRDLLVGRERERYLRIRRGDRTLVRAEFDDRPDDHMGTVGAVARDAGGSIAAATSTGGTQDKYPGRVGDSPLIGSGTYADSRAGGASCTGWGEGILRVVLAKSTIDCLDHGTADRVVERAITLLDRVDGKGGVILVDAQGNAAVAYNTPRMARGLVSAGSPPMVGVDRDLRDARELGV